MGHFKCINLDLVAEMIKTAVSSPARSRPEAMFVRGGIPETCVIDYPHQYEPAEVELQDKLPISDATKFEFFEGVFELCPRACFLIL
jgi:hypothetical protein